MFREEIQEIADNIHQQGIILFGGLGLLERGLGEGRIKHDPSLYCLSYTDLTIPVNNFTISGKEEKPISRLPNPSLNFPRPLKVAVRTEQNNTCIICGTPLPEGSKLQIHHRVMKRHFEEVIRPVTNEKEQQEWQKFIKSKDNALGACPQCHKVADRLGIKNHQVCEADIDNLPERSQVRLEVVRREDILSYRSS